MQLYTRPPSPTVQVSIGVCLGSLVAAMVVTFPTSLLVLAVSLLLGTLCYVRWEAVVGVIAVVTFLVYERLIVAVVLEQFAASLVRETLIAVTIASLVVMSRPRLKLGRLLALYLAVLVAGLLWSPDPVRGVAALRFYLVWPLLAVAAYSVRWTFRSQQVLKNALLSLCLIAAVIGLFQYFTSYALNLPVTEAQMMAARRFGILGSVGPTANRPDFGLLMGVGCLIAVHSAVTARAFQDRAMPAFVAFACVAALFTSLSRTAVVAAGVSLISVWGYASHDRWRPRRLTYSVLALIAAGWLMTSVASMPEQGLPVGLEYEATSFGSLGERADAWNERVHPALSMPRRAFLGSGLGSLGASSQISQVTTLVSVADNTFLAIFLEIGGIGFLLALLLFIRGTRILWVMGDRPGRTLLVGLLVFLLAFGSTVDIIHSSPGVPLAYIVLGVLVRPGKS